MCPSQPSGNLAATPFAAKPDDTTFPDETVEITVFAAASLTDVYAEIADAVEEAHPNITVIVETAGSQTLVTQLSQGARADVLATANMKTMQQARDAELIDGQPQIFAANRLVIVTPPENPAGIESMDDLTGDDIRLVVAAKEVPAGAYAREAICVWADGDRDAVSAIGDNIVSEELDVRSVLTKVLLGEADAGVVYATDAITAQHDGARTNVVEFPDGVPVETAYPIAPVSGGHTEAAEAFIAFVLGDNGQQVLESHGFRPAR